MRNTWIIGRRELVAFSANGGNIIGQVRTAIDRSGLDVAEMFIERGRLEDVFRDLTLGAPVAGEVKEEAGNA
ncbi:MAG: hypothetical protein O7B98_04280 [Alphaproteobacteria bacterium]|nr:hypothetical protein [Alphaproteobacteria bacterium]